MDILTTKYNKKSLEERNKTNFLLKFNGYHDKSYIYRPVKKHIINNELGIKIKNHHFGKISKYNNTSNCYYLKSYYKKNNILHKSLRSLETSAQSLDSLYYLFLGYYELESSQDNYIKFIENYLFYCFKHFEGFLKLLKSKYFNNFIKHEKYSDYSNCNLDLNIKLPQLLKCPDINKFTVHNNIRDFFNLHITDYSNFKNDLKLFIKKIENYINKIKTTNDISFLFDYKDIEINNFNINLTLLDDYGFGKQELHYKTNYDIEEEYDNEDMEQSLDVYYKIFNNTTSLFEIFETAFNNLKEKNFKNIF